MARWRLSIFNFLFLVFSSIILITIGFFSVVNYQTINARLTSLAMENLTALSRTLVVNIDNQLLNMNRISMVPVFSQTFRDLWPTVWRSPSSAKAMKDLLKSVDGTFQGVRQINIYSLDGYRLATSDASFVVPMDVTTKPWYAAVAAAAGERIITGVQLGQPLEGIATFDSKRRYISLCRLFTVPETGQKGVIEVAQECGELFQYLNVLSSSGGNSRRITIIDHQGGQIFPYDRRLPDLDWVVAGRPQDLSIQAITSPSPEEGRPTILSYSHSLDADWTLVVIQDEEHFYSDTADLVRQLLYYAIVVSLVTLLAAFWVARLVSDPLHRMTTRMAQFSLEEEPAPPIGGGVIDLSELTMLHMAFERLRSELRRSFAEAVLLRAHKHRAQIVALHSQMNPHFMFNMLATIGVMAEEGQADQIPALVEGLAEMMRSIASSEETEHTLGAEFEFVQLYLQTMKYRFLDDLEFHLECPEVLTKVEVPRLLLQPFVENAIKHMTQQRPPWRIKVKAETCLTLDRPGWRVVVEDNGPGFRQESLQQIRSQMARIRAQAPDLADLPGLHIRGMGLINTFIRLHLNYGAAAVLEVGTGPSEGGRVCVGGSLDD